MRGVHFRARPLKLYGFYLHKTKINSKRFFFYETPTTLKLGGGFFSHEIQNYNGFPGLPFMFLTSNDISYKFCVFSARTTAALSLVVFCCSVFGTEQIEFRRFKSIRFYTARYFVLQKAQPVMAFIARRFRYRRRGFLVFGSCRFVNVIIISNRAN